MQRFFAKFQIRPVCVIRQTQHAVFAADRRDALYIRNIPEVIGRSDVYGGGKSARAESLFQFFAHAARAHPARNHAVRAFFRRLPLFRFFRRIAKIFVAVQPRYVEIKQRRRA